AECVRVADHDRLVVVLIVGVDSRNGSHVALARILVPEIAAEKVVAGAQAVVDSGQPLVIVQIGVWAGVQPVARVIRQRDVRNQSQGDRVHAGAGNGVAGEWSTGGRVDDGFAAA